MYSNWYIITKRYVHKPYLKNGRLRLIRSMKKTIGCIIICMLFLTSILSVAVSASDWPMFHHDLNRSGFTDLDAPETNNVLWTFSTEGIHFSSPAISNRKVYFGTTDGIVYCLDADDGTEIWSNTTNGAIYSSPAVYNGKVYIGSNDKKFYCLNAESGEKLWYFTTGGEIYSSPIVAYGNVYVGSYDGKLYCLDAETGIHEWNFSTGGKIYSSPAIDTKKIFIGSYDGKKLYSLNVDNGEEIWNFETDGNFYYSSPAVNGGKIYIGADSNRKVYCLNSNDGEEIWNYTTGFRVMSSPAISNNKIYIGSNDKKVYCLDAINGDPIWNYETGMWIMSSPAIADEKVYFGSYDRNFYCLDADDGSKIWSYTTEGIISGSPAIANGRVYVGSDSGTFYCFGDMLEEDNLIINAPSSVTKGEEFQITVSNANDGFPVSEAEITFNQSVYYTSQIGELNLTAPFVTENTSYIITANKPGYGGDTATILVINNVSIPTEGLSVVAPTFVVEGESFLVTVYLNSKLLEDAEVTFLEEMHLTDVNGKVDFSAPLVEDNTDYQISASYNDYDPYIVTITVFNQDEAEMGWIYGIVSDNFGSSLNGVQICAALSEKESKCTFTNQGAYILQVASGSYSVKAIKQGYISDIISDINVVTNSATELNFILEKDISSIIDNDREFIEYAIQKEEIGARISVDSSGEFIFYYSDRFAIVDLISTEEMVSFTIGADDDTSGTIVVVYIEEGILNDLTSLAVTYDGDFIEKSIDIDTFFDLQGNTDLGWLQLSTSFILLRVPEFSEHTITISSLVDALGRPIAVVMYVVSLTVALILFAIPAQKWPYLPNYFRKRKK